MNGEAAAPKLPAAAAPIPRQPSLYLAHGLPSYALEGYPERKGLKDAQAYVTMLKSVRTKIKEPKAILCMSGHWVTNFRGVRVTTSRTPKTIHEFYGFPQELYDMRYPAPGSPGVAAAVQAVAPEISGDPNWGLDHGSWTLLCHIRPQADIPVVELSVDNSKSGLFYFQLGRKLRALRDKGVVIMGSGSIVHNLRQLRWGGPPHTWASAFNKWVIDHVMQGKDGPLMDYKVAPGGRMSVPTPDHYFPFLFALGAAHDDEERTKLIDWIDNGANGMTSFGFGLKAK